MIVCPSCHCEFKIAGCPSINPETKNSCGLPSGHSGDQHSKGPFERWTEKMTTGVLYEMMKKAPAR